MKPQTLLILVLVISFIPFQQNSDTFAQGSSLNKIQSFGEGKLRQPGTPLMSWTSLLTDMDGDYLYIFDFHGSSPFIRIETQTGETLSFGKWGNGPLEIPRQTPKFMSLTESWIVAHDFIRNVGVVYDRKTLEPVANLQLNSIRQQGPLYIISDNEAVVVPYSSTESDSYAQKFKIDDTWDIEATGYLGSIDELEWLQPFVANPRLKIGPFISETDTNALYIGNIYSSLLFSLNKNGELLYKTTEPNNNPIPDAELRRQQTAQGVGVTGDPDESVESVIDLTTDSDYLYALYSGSTLNKETVQQSLMGAGTSKEIEDIRIGEAGYINIYDKTEGTFIETLELDLLAVSISATDQYLYAGTWEEESRIIQFENPMQN